MGNILEIKRAANKEAMLPLIELCKAGRLFEVQAWIAAGNPVNAPPIPAKGARPKSPLEVAIEYGFHSLVQVLLEAGAVQEPQGWDSPMNQVLDKRRFDLVQLLVQHGFDPKTIDMGNVFASWDPQIMEYFINQGADLVRGRPFAYAFCDRIQTAIKFFKLCRERTPEIQEQANIALRHHCKEGNLKWISLLLWAGADPWKRGADNPREETCDEEDGTSALGFAALYEHFEVFDLKPIRTTLNNPQSKDFLRYLTKGTGLVVLKRMLEAGVSPNDLPNGGCSALNGCFWNMSWDWSPRSYFWGDNGTRKIDTERSRDGIKAIHLLAKHGAMWLPQDDREIGNVRRSFLKLIPDYTMEFVWVMSKYRACGIEAVLHLVDASSMKKHLADYRGRLGDLLELWRE